MLMFGYPQTRLINEHINKLIPNFGNDCDYLGYVRSRNATLSSLDNEESETETDHVDMLEKNDELSNNASSNVKLNYSEVSSPIKDPRKVCLDFTNSKLNDEESLVISTFDENADVVVSAQENGENNRNATNVSVCSSPKIVRMGNGQQQKEDNYMTALSDCELLTPVNETSKYITMGKNISTSTNGGKEPYINDDPEALKQVTWEYHLTQIFE
jgi:PAS domain-containing serine/threonine kinase